MGAGVMMGHDPGVAVGSPNTVNLLLQALERAGRRGGRRRRAG